MKYVRGLKLFQDTYQRDRFLGFDVGEKYIGLSLSERDNKVVAPLMYPTHLYNFNTIFNSYKIQP